MPKPARFPDVGQDQRFSDSLERRLETLLDLMEEPVDATTD
jgi:hypothetical protein